jgi:hypothetical protein
MRDAVLTQIDDEARRVHHHLTPDDDCYFLVEFVKSAGYGPPGNDFIFNLKKKPQTEGTAQWRYKLIAIDDAARTLRRELPDEWLSDSTFVPVPPSKAKDDPEYDDRMTQVLLRLGDGVDTRELVYQTGSMDETHSLDDRHSIETLVENYEIDEDQVRPEPSHIVVVDDMVTAGVHFRAMYRVLEERFPGVPISGVFLARRVFPENNG